MFFPGNPLLPPRAGIMAKICKATYEL